MERIPLGNGRFLIQLSPEEIARLNEVTRMAVRTGVKCVNVLRKLKGRNELSPAKLHEATKTAMESTARAANIIAKKPQ